MRPSILRLDKHPGRKLTAPRVSHIAGAGSVIDQEVLAERELPCSGTLPGCRRHLRPRPVVLSPGDNGNTVQ